jgi:hypothetical protein
MNRSIKEVAKVLLIIIALAVGVLSGNSDVWAQQKTSSLGQQIQGSWILVSIYNEIDGKKIDVFGTSPRGSMILTPDGHFSIIIMKASLPKFASNNRIKGTTEDNQAIVQGSVAYFGSYKVANEKEQMVNLHIEGCTFPNWDGEDQIRVMNVAGDEMKLTNPTAAVGGKNYLVWKRVK